MLSQSCDIKSPIKDGDGVVLRDPITGQPRSTDGDTGLHYTVTTTAARCRLSEANGREINNERMRDGTEITHKLFLEDVESITEEDVVTITDADGVVLATDADVGNVYRLSGFGGIGDHLEVMLKVRRPSGP